MISLNRIHVATYVTWLGASLWLASPSYGQDPCATSATASLYGVVSSEGGEPIAGVSIVVTWASGRGEVMSEPGGAYRICSVPYGTPITILAADRSALANPIQLELPGPGRYELDLTVETIASTATLGTGAITGTAVDLDTGEPIAGGRVSVPEAGVDALTSDKGTFRLDGIAPGERGIVLEHLAYGERQASVRVLADATAVVRLRVPARAIELEPLEVVVEGIRVHSLETRGFYERREWGEAVTGARFFDEEEIRRRNPRLISHLIADAPSARLDCSQNRSLGSRNCVLRFTGAPGCASAEVYLNGIRVIRSDNQASAIPIDQLVQPSEVAAVEVYPSASSLPARFSGSTGQCGTVVIWTK